jgi:hypothetical protein
MLDVFCFKFRQQACQLTLMEQGMARLEKLALGGAGGRDGTTLSCQVLLQNVK